MFRLDTEDSEGFEMENQILGCQFSIWNEVDVLKYKTGDFYYFFLISYTEVYFTYNKIHQF